MDILFSGHHIVLLLLRQLYVSHQSLQKSTLLLPLGLITKKQHIILGAIWHENTKIYSRIFTCSQKHFVPQISFRNLLGYFTICNCIHFHDCKNFADSQAFTICIVSSGNNELLLHNLFIQRMVSLPPYKYVRNFA